MITLVRVFLALLEEIVRLISMSARRSHVQRGNVSMASILTRACVIQDSLGMTVTSRSTNVIQHRARMEEFVMTSWLTSTVVVQLGSMERLVTELVLRVVTASTVRAHVTVLMVRAAMQ